MIVGINTDPAWFAAELDTHAKHLKTAGFTMARFPLVSGREQLAANFCRALHNAGMDPLPVFVRESGSDLGHWAQHLPTCRYWQIGNEADHHSNSSWTLEKSRFSTLLEAARSALPQEYLVAGGLVSGNPAYLDGADLSPVDAIAVHPYGRRMTGYPRAGWGFGEATELITQYKRFSKPLWITEWGGKTQDFSSQLERTDYHRWGVITLHDAGCAACFPFKWEDNGVPGFGLVNTSALAAITEQIGKLALIPPKPLEGNAMPAVYQLDDDTKKELARRNLVAASDYIVEGGGGKVFTAPPNAGILYYVNGTGVWGFVPFE